MKKTFFTFLMFLCANLIFAQNKTAVEEIVNKGIYLHDEGKYNEALAKYEEALNLDKNNIIALSEKAMTLNALKKYDEAIEVCKLILKLYPKESNGTVYVTYGNALDHSNNSDKAIKIYNKGLELSPNYYQLYFNKGIALANQKKYDEAIQSFQTSTKLSPNHLGSFNALAILSRHDRIPSILASCRYLVLDNQSANAKKHFEDVINLMQQGISKEADNSISISLDSKIAEKVESDEITENDFSTVDMILTFAAAADHTEENGEKTAVEKFISKFETICDSMNEIKQNQKGYYWDFLSPYFIEMRKNNLIEPFANTLFLSVQDKDAIQYVEQNQSKLEDFYDWSANYKWK